MVSNKTNSKIRRSRLPFIGTIFLAIVLVLQLSTHVHATSSKHQHHLRQNANLPDLHRINHRPNSKRRNNVSPVTDVSRGGARGNNALSPQQPARASKRILRSMRILYLTYYASLGALMPYLPVYFHSLGHTGSSIGLLGAVKPLTTFLVAPLWGVISDWSGDHVSTLQFTFVSSLILQLLVGTNSNLQFLIATVFATALLNAPVKSLIDTIVMSKLTSEEDKYQFGRMRLWGQLGFGVGSSLVGYLLSMFPADATSQPATTPDKAGETKGTSIMEGLKLLSLNSDALIFFFLVFVIGTSSGCVENFAYVRVREVGGSGSNMGILRLVSSLAGAPMFWFSGPLTEALGVDVVLVLSLLAYVARFLNYAWMKHPYQALPAEALRGLTFALFWSSGSTYAHKISPPGMKATMLMIMNAMYGGLGQSLGAIIGGKMQSKLGTINTFVYSGIFDLCFVGVLVAYLMSKKERAFTTKGIVQP
ncbi:hypothetical protein THAPSDRAFT_268048 [Thalassiosira pseudonana CCMP1335]|uniref:Major facilitator superfamily (MFS) profile domain-containing protein n=1 Tax=Thalassiosira pseudonana TaxID=35128 RepID=B8BR57_THAPS|nr:hypothetical protein THAPSDRAFT_268048 [Thalassiosira pseudonana CCMP1335]EED96473.1 hypothetical protein THAPSDRAFT_268048 [Thalassiosira pseudonana CCMP1335]